MKRCAALFVLGAALAAPAGAKDFSVQWVEAVNNDVRCTRMETGWVFSTMGPCRDFRAPDTVAIGQSFSANGESHTIRVIIATQSEINYEVDDWEIKKGDWWCRAAENMNDLKEGAAKRTWLLIRKCLPVR